MKSEVMIKEDLGAFTLFAEMLEVTISDIARGLVYGYCSKEGRMLAPCGLTDKAAKPRPRPCPGRETMTLDSEP